MRAVARPHAAAAAAAVLVGSSVIAVSTFASEPEIAAEPAVRLTGAFSNVTVNLLQDIASVPANMIFGLQDLTAALDYTGPWAVYGPTNVLGTDRADPPKYKGAVNFLVPFPAMSVPLGEMVSTIAQAQIPMYSGCPWLGKLCTDLPGLLADNWQVPLLELLTGYTFPVVVNPADGEEEPWSGETVKIEPFAPLKAYVNSLLVEPDGIETVSLGVAVQSIVEFGVALFDAFNLFVQGSYLYDPNVNPVSFLIPPFLGRILCNCDDPNEKPYPTAPSDDGDELVAANAVVDRSAVRVERGDADDPVDADSGTRPVAESEDKPVDQELPRAAASAVEADAAGTEETGEESADPLSSPGEEPSSDPSPQDEDSSGAADDEDSSSASAEDSSEPSVEPADADEGDAAAGDTEDREYSKFPGRLVEAVDSVSERLSAGASKIADGPDAPSPRVVKSGLAKAESTSPASSGNKSEPRRVTGTGSSSRGLLGGVAKSVGDRVSAGIGRLGDGKKGGAATTSAGSSRNAE